MARRRAASDDASALARRRRGGQSSLPQGSTKGRRRVRPQGLGGYATVHETSTETTDSSTLILKYNTPKQQRWLVFGGFGRSPPPPSCPPRGSVVLPWYLGLGLAGSWAAGRPDQDSPQPYPTAKATHHSATHLAQPGPGLPSRRPSGPAVGPRTS